MFLCQAISVSPSTSLLVRMCWPYTDRLSADHTYCALQPCRTDVCQQYCWSTAAAEDMAAKAGWISYVQPAVAGAPAAFVAYEASGPCHGTPSPDLLSNRSSTAGWASITIIAILITNGCWLVTSARVYCQCGCPIYRHTQRNGARFLPQVYRKDTSVCPNNHIDFGDNFNFGDFVYRRV